MLGGWMDVCFCELLLSRKHTRGMCGSLSCWECGSGSSCSSPPHSPLACRRYCLFILRMSNGGSTNVSRRFDFFLSLLLSFVSENFNESLNKSKALWCEWRTRLLCFQRDVVVVFGGGGSATSSRGHALRFARRCFQSHFFFFPFWQRSHRAFCFRAVWCLFWGFTFHNCYSGLQILDQHPDKSTAATVFHSHTHKPWSFWWG